MKILTGYSGIYKQAVDVHAELCRALDHELIPVYLDRKEYDVGESYFKKFGDKPQFIQDMRKKIQAPVLYVDADVFVVDDVSEIEGDWDVALCLKCDQTRSKQCEISEYYNVWLGIIQAGVMWFNNTDGADRFIKRWINYLSRTKVGSDQEAVARLIYEGFPNLDLDYHVNKVIDFHGIRIKFLPELIYNYPLQFNEDLPPVVEFAGQEHKTKIWHMKKKRFVAILNKSRKFQSWAFANGLLKSSTDVTQGLSRKSVSIKAS